MLSSCTASEISDAACSEGGACAGGDISAAACGADDACNSDISSVTCSESGQCSGSDIDDAVCGDDAACAGDIAADACPTSNVGACGDIEADSCGQPPAPPLSPALAPPPVGAPSRGGLSAAGVALLIVGVITAVFIIWAAVAVYRQRNAEPSKTVFVASVATTSLAKEATVVSAVSSKADVEPSAKAAQSEVDAHDIELSAKTSARTADDIDVAAPRGHVA